LRKRAADAGNLKSTREQKVLVEEDKIIIEPADTRVIYVPTYDPYLVYGPWWYPAYPPYYFYSAPYPGVVFSFGIGVTLGLPWGYAWGGWDWYNYSVLINVNRNIRYNNYIDRSRYIQRYERRGQPIRSGVVSWRHDPDHRRGVAYKGKVTARDFGQLPARSGEVRPESRGFSSPSRSGMDTRGVGVGTDRGRIVTAPSGVAERKVRKEDSSGARITSPKAPRESIFSGGDNNGTRVRRSSERGSQSVGGANVYRRDNAVQPRRGSGTGGSIGGGVNRGGESDPFGGKRRR